MELINQIGFILIGACLFSCSKPISNGAEQDQEVIINVDGPRVKNDSSSMHVLKSLISIEPSRGLAYFKGELFTGFAVVLYHEQNFESKVSYVDGVKDGKSEKWFQNGLQSYTANYSLGKLHGTSHSWWKNGNLRSTSIHVNGISEGYQKQWYRSGAKFKTRLLKNGQEYGLQQSWRENGKLYNNYEAKNGRIFGLKRSKLCFKLDDEEIVKNK